MENYYVLPFNTKLDNLNLKTSGDTITLGSSRSIHFRTVKIIREVNGLAETFDILNIKEFNKWLLGLEDKTAKQIKCSFKNITNSKISKSIINKSSPLIMGILNITKNSFYDGGRFNNNRQAINFAKEMSIAGADIIDVGGESTKPNAHPISIDEEIKKIVPIIEELTSNNILVSCDTRNSKTMTAAIKAGAKIINDISYFKYDDKTLSVILESNCYYVITHNLGKKINMQLKPSNKNFSIGVYKSLHEKVKIIQDMGIVKERMIIDPGIGFNKLDIHNFDILNNLSLYMGIGCPLLVGTSRKSLISRNFKNILPKDRLPGSIALAIDSFMKGSRILRVHDVKETIQAISLYKSANL